MPSRHQQHAPPEPCAKSTSVLYRALSYRYLVTVIEKRLTHALWNSLFPKPIEGGLSDDGIHCFSFHMMRSDIVKIEFAFRRYNLLHEGH